MKHLILIFFFVSFSSFAQEECPFNNTYFLAYTSDHQESVEICVQHRTLRYTATHRGKPEKTIIQELKRVNMNKVLNGYELIVRQGDTLYAIMDNNQHPSLLTINNERKIVFFTDLDSTYHFVSRLHALKLMIDQPEKDDGS